ncbi:Fur family transcriptional regulator [Proteinivorax hydrogeniformans]|uniref:Fur family transcriptional regulator n=1 Tax=Proteinivorax hydrogeniformans TaxID=1826727 RepID=A0AAU8HU87_9FIRM
MNTKFDIESDKGNKTSAIRDIMEDSGYKLTEQRQIIADYFLKSAEHLNAKDIYNDLKGLNIGLATIYRTVNILKEIGVLKEVVVDKLSYYELKIYTQKPSHIHFKCAKCNDIIDISKNTEKYLQLIQTLKNEQEVTIWDINTTLTGICKNCREGDNA